jgi:hypothetical protein
VAHGLPELPEWAVFSLWHVYQSYLSGLDPSRVWRFILMLCGRLCLRVDDVISLVSVPNPREVQLSGH